MLLTALAQRGEAVPVLTGGLQAGGFGMHAPFRRAFTGGYLQEIRVMAEIGRLLQGVWAFEQLRTADGKEFLGQQELGVEAKRLSDATLKYLQSLDFPGNVRQLENLCHWLTVMAPGQTVEVADLPPELKDQPTREHPANWGDALMAETDRVLAQHPGEVFDMLNRDFERILIRRALMATGGRRIEAAQLLGIGRNTITRKIQELGLDDPDPA